MTSVRQAETLNGIGLQNDQLFRSLQKQPSERTRKDYDAIVDALFQFPAFQGCEVKMLYSIIPCAHFELLAKGDELGKSAKKLKRRISFQRSDPKVKDGSFRSNSTRQKHESIWYMLVSGSIIYELERLEKGSVFEVSKEALKGHNHRWGKKKDMQIPVAITNSSLVRFTYLPEEVKESGHAYRSSFTAHLESIESVKQVPIGKRLSISYSQDCIYPNSAEQRSRNLSSLVDPKSQLTNSTESELIPKDPLIVYTGPSPQKKMLSNNSDGLLSPSLTEGSTGHSFPFGVSPSPAWPRHSQCSVGSESAHSQNSSTDYSLGSNGDKGKSDPKPPSITNDMSLFSIDKFLPDFITETVSKLPQDRTEEEISNISTCLKNAPAFTSFSDPVRWRICSKMRYKSVPSIGMVVLKQGETVDCWYVILSGSVEMFIDGQSPFKLQIGSSFGLGPKLTPLTCKGNMMTAEANCIFGYLPLEQLKSILEENQQKRVTQFEGDKPISVQELRQGSGGQYGYVILQATPDMLLSQLVETSIDEKYIEYFLLTYRVFLPQPSGVSYRIEHWFSTPNHSIKAVQVLLIWLRNHYTDFEHDNEMQDFLDKFIHMLKVSGREMAGYADSIRELRAIKSSLRYVSMSALHEQVSPIAIGGGAEIGFPILVTKVTKTRLLNIALLQGDELVSINGNSCTNKTSNWARKLLFSGIELEVGVKYSRDTFDRFMSLPREFHVTGFNPGYITPNAISSPDLSSLNCESDSQPNSSHKRSPGGLLRRSFRLKPASSNEDKSKSLGSSSQLDKQYDRFLKRRGSLPKNFVSKSRKNFLARPVRNERAATVTPDSSVFGEEDSASSSNERHSDQNSRYPSGTYTLRPTRANSGIALKKHILKLYYVDHSFRYILISLLTRSCDVIQLGLQEYNADSATFYTSHEHHHLCLATVDANGIVKTSILPPTLSNLPSKYLPGCRFYVKPSFIVGSICHDEVAKEMFQESLDLVKLTNLDSERLARRVTLRDSTMFRSIPSTDYISDIFKCYSPNNRKQLQEFIDLSNAERWWVCTEVVNERNISVRAKIIKMFIKLASSCRQLNNFNAMFSVISGLDHNSVSRLKTTWDRVSGKYKRILNDLKVYLNPMRNMGEYRSLLRTVSQSGVPCIPMFPIVQKDLTVIHMSNSTHIDGMVNFDKLRLLSEKIYILSALCPKPYQSLEQDVTNTTHNTTTDKPKYVAITSPIKRQRKSSSYSNNMEYRLRYEDELMNVCIEYYIDTINSRIIDDEVQLEVLSQLCEFTLTGSRRTSQQKRTTSLSRISSFSVKAGSSTHLIVPEKKPLSSTRSFEFLSK
ncbi:Rap guanine nucleotide exchange factor 2 [Oopsacas minuta]|uniref:Rap guanine nucleotide exchange factor 2 n=1 Tax=Oopsacas minuta TaxID=111878 RepID=A0AAV7K5D9_9METZ|nr:Rap guanine nucleotide exchange factor 2 [Oopsacas minuta]